MMHENEMNVVLSSLFFSYIIFRGINSRDLCYVYTHVYIYRKSPVIIYTLAAVASDAPHKFNF